jgi:hypothetical protein
MSDPRTRSREYGHNGARVVYDRKVLKFAVFDHADVLCGYRYTFERACEFAATLQGAPRDPALPPAAVSRSERAVGYWGDGDTHRVSPGVQPEETATFVGVPRHHLPPDPPRRDPIAESRERSRRQGIASRRQYGH